MTEHQWEMVDRNNYECKFCRLAVRAQSIDRIHSPPCNGRLDLLAPIGRGDQLAAAIDTVTLGQGKRIAKAAASLLGRESCGCDERQKQLNREYPLVELPANQEPGTVLLRFGHGLGDRAQFTSVLRHLKKYAPQWDIDVLTLPGSGCMYRDYCRTVYEQWELFARLEHEDTYHHVRYVDFPNPETCYADSPSTKVEQVLRKMFSISPDPTLSGYMIRYSDEDLDRARAWSQAHGKVALLHYHGQHAKRKKNISEQVIAPILAELRQEGYTPAVLDLHDKPRSQPVRRGEVLHLGQHHPLWGGEQMPPVSMLAALGQAAERIVGIDSGPEHIWASETITTPMMVLWRKYHPLHFFPPSKRITHVLPRGLERRLEGDEAAREAGLRYFHRHYRSEQATERLEQAAGGIARAWLTAPAG